MTKQCAFGPFCRCGSALEPLCWKKETDSPSEPSLYYCGRYLAEYLRAHPMRERAPFVADLAALERAIVEVFQGRDAAALAPDALRAIAPADWPAIKLKLQAAAQLLALDWRVSALVRAVEDARPWEPPEQQPVKVLVWRHDTRVFHRELETVEADALEAIARGELFAEICDRVAAGDQDPVTSVNRMLARWLSDGLLASG